MDGPELWGNMCHETSSCLRGLGDSYEAACASFVALQAAAQDVALKQPAFSEALGGTPILKSHSPAKPFSVQGRCPRRPRKAELSFKLQETTMPYRHFLCERGALLSRAVR